MSSGKPMRAKRTLDRVVRRIRRRYVRVVKMGSQWNTYLQVDHQGFAVVEQTTKRRAMWFGDMLAVALDRLMKSNK